MQEIVELLVFALLALLVGTGLVWLAGWAMEGIGFVFRWLAGLVWSLLRFVVPVAIVAAAVYALVKVLRRQEATPTADAGSGGPGAAPTAPDASPAPDARATAASHTASTTVPEAAPTDPSPGATPPVDDEDAARRAGASPVVPEAIPDEGDGDDAPTSDEESDRPFDVHDPDDEDDRRS